MRDLCSLALSALCAGALAAAPVAASPPFNVTEIGHLDLDPSCGWSDALFVHDGIAYITEWRGTPSGPGCQNAAGWLRVVDVSDPAAPAHLTQIQLRGWQPGDMHGLYYTNGYLYCAIQTQTPGVSIFDVRDPRNPVEVGFVPVATGAHNLRVADSRLYVLPNGDDQSDIVIYDLADPVNPVRAGSFNVGPGYGCHDISVMENVGYASCWDDGLYVLDVTDPASIGILGIGGSNLENVHSAWPTPDLRTVVTCQEIADQGVRTFDVTSPTTPTSVGRYNLGTGTLVHDVMVVGRYAYVTYYRDGVKVLDLADATNPTEVGSFSSTPDCANSCGAIGQWVEDGLLYVTDMKTGFWILSFDLPHETTITMYAVKSASAQDVELVWNHTGESQYTLRDGIDKRTIGTRLTDIDGKLRHTERNAIADGQLHFYKLNGPWR